MSPPMQELFPFLECLISTLTREHQPSGMTNLYPLVQKPQNHKDLIGFHLTYLGFLTGVTFQLEFIMSRNNSW